MKPITILRIAEDMKVTPECLSIPTGGYRNISSPKNHPRRVAKTLRDFGFSDATIPDAAYWLAGMDSDIHLYHHEFEAKFNLRLTYLPGVGRD
jgi:hypothetical protein